MYRKYALITGFSVGLGLGGSAVADEVADQVAAIPGGVEDVSIGGTWQSGDRSGAYRLVVARSGGEKITARLFVQWIAYGDTGEATVDNSIEITELDGSQRRHRQSSPRKRTTTAFRSSSTRSTRQAIPARSYELHVFSPTDYMFGPASN